MKKFLIVSGIVILSVIILAAGLLAYQFLFRVKKYEKGAAKIGSCQNLNPAVTEFGKVGVEITSNSTHKGIAGLDVRLGENPDAAIFCESKTGANGLALFDQVPEGQWKVFYNPTTTPPEFLGHGPGSEGVIINVSKGITSEVGIGVK